MLISKRICRYQLERTVPMVFFSSNSFFRYRSLTRILDKKSKGYYE